MKAQKIVDKPVPIWLIEVSSGNHSRAPDEMILTQFDDSLIGYAYRGVAAKQLPLVYRNGIDVEPTNQVIYVAEFEKAWEYGDFPKLMLAFEWNKLSMTFCEVSAALPANEIDTLRQRFPTMLKSTNGEKLYLSRLAEHSPQLNTDYEWAYARWIEDNPFEALRALLLFVRPEDKSSMASILTSLTLDLQEP